MLIDEPQAIADELQKRNAIGKRIIAIGASAGGIEPTKELLSKLPAEFDATVIVVIHLSPEHNSVLDSILERASGYKVEIATDGLSLKPGCIFLIPPGKNLQAQDGRFKLTDQIRTQSGRPPYPIDIFFTSIAENYGNKAVGVVLSGTGSDGSRGVKALHELGGIAFAQDPRTSEFDGMPQSAISTGAVHQVMHVDDIAENLIRISATEIIDDEAAVHKNNDEQIKRIFNVMADYGADFSQYKKKFILKGLERRRILTHSETYDDYLDQLVSSEEEKAGLKNDLLISVTNFFRDPQAWESLRRTVRDHLIPQLEESEVMRIWVAGCATGEEAYSVAIMVSKLIRDSGRFLDYKIYATDLSEHAIDVAAKGLYSYSAVESIDQDILNEFFTATSGGYEISREVKKRVITANHNLIQDAPFTKIHLVCCRNVLIYMEPELQKQMIHVFHFSLQMGGVLFLGPSETLGTMDPEFKVQSHEWNISTKSTETRVPIHLSSPVLRRAVAVRQPTEFRKKEKLESQYQFYRAGLEAVCKRYKKSALIVNRMKKVVLIVRDENSLLQVAAGEPNSDVAKLIVPSLVPIITINLQKLIADSTEVTSEDITCVNNQGDEVQVDLTISNLGNESGEELYLVLLSKSQSQTAPIDGDREFGGSNSDVALPVMQQKLQDTQWQLDEARRVLFDTIEELEFSNDQQQATTEQLTAANEELQSTNEELQSVNEELYTVNFEYQSKIHELSDLTHDLDNLLECTCLGVVFLDTELCIRRFTDRATKILQLQTKDIGCPISDFVTSIDFPDLPEVITRVISLGESHERDIPFRGVRDRLHIGIHPYRVESEFSQGVIISMLDLADLNTFAVDQTYIDSPSNAEPGGTVQIEAPTARQLAADVDER